MWNSKDKAGHAQMEISYGYGLFLRRLGELTLEKDNCFKISENSKMLSRHSSPFIASIAIRFLNALPSHPLQKKLIDRTLEYLLTVIEDTGLIGFLDPNHHRFDVDTLACVYACLYERLPCRISTDLTKILNILKKNRSEATGAYYTWIEKKNNNIDYMVNVNVRAFFEIIGKQDPALDRFLNINSRRFIHNGSYYYRNIAFPLFLMSLYKMNCQGQSNSTAFVTTICNILTHVKSLESLEVHKSIFEKRNISDASASCQFQLVLFHSKDGRYYSPLLEEIISYCISANYINLGLQGTAYPTVHCAGALS